VSIAFAPRGSTLPGTLAEATFLTFQNKIHLHTASHTQSGLVGHAAHTQRQDSATHMPSERDERLGRFHEGLGDVSAPVEDALGRGDARDHALLQHVLPNDARVDAA